MEAAETAEKAIALALEVAACRAWGDDGCNQGPGLPWLNLISSCMLRISKKGLGLAKSWWIFVLPQILIDDFADV